MERPVVAGVDHATCRDYGLTDLVTRLGRQRLRAARCRLGGPSLGVDVATSVVAQVVGLATVALGLINWTHWRIRVLLYTGQPDWS